MLEASEPESPNQDHRDPGDRSASAEPSLPAKPLVRSRQRGLIMEYSLVLLSQNIDHEVAEWEGRFAIWIAEENKAIAREVLHTYVRENRGFYAETPTPPLQLLLSPTLYLIWPTAFHFWVGFSEWPQAWRIHGAADAQKILVGEWWRTLTATTLHSDHSHYLSNLFSGYFMLNLLAHRLGMGTILFLGVLTSMVANYLVALSSGMHHISVGFSTTVFSVLGMLAGVETLHRPKTPGLKFRHIHPLLAAFSVALLVGIGENVDIKAHFFGFGLGVAAGLMTRRFPKVMQTPKLQWAMGLAAYAAYAICWNLAMGWVRF